MSWGGCALALQVGFPWPGVVPISCGARSGIARGVPQDIVPGGACGAGPGCRESAGGSWWSVWGGSGDLDGVRSPEIPVGIPVDPRGALRSDGVRGHGAWGGGDGLAWS